MSEQTGCYEEAAESDKDYGREGDPSFRDGGGAGSSRDCESKGSRGDGAFGFGGGEDRLIGTAG